MRKGWKFQKIDDICLVTDYVANGSFKSLNENVKYNYSEDYAILLRTTDYSKRWKKEFVYVSEESYKFLRKSNLLIDDVIISNVGATGITFMVPDLGRPMTLGPNAILVRSRDFKALSQKFIYHFFNCTIGQDLIKGITSGTTQSKFNKTNFRELLISVPTLNEQNRIVAILDEAFEAIDQAKANTERNLQNAKELFQSELNSILYNKKWKIKQLGEVCTKVEYGTSSKSKPEGQLPVLRMGNIQNGRFVWDNLVYSQNEEDNQKYLLKYNDVLFNRTNSPELVGKTAIYKGEMPAIFAGYLIRILRKEDLLDADYLNFYLNSKMALEFGKTVVISSVNQANINGTKLKTYPIPLPTLSEQQQIVNQLDTLSIETKQLEENYRKKLENLEELKKSILQKAFSGELTRIKEMAL
jgi:type I restriction enzyme S subunit